MVEHSVPVGAGIVKEQTVVYTVCVHTSFVHGMLTVGVITEVRVPPDSVVREGETGGSVIEGLFAAEDVSRAGASEIVEVVGTDVSGAEVSDSEVSDGEVSDAEVPGAEVEITGSDVAGSDVAGAEVAIAGSDVAGSDVAGAEVVGADVAGAEVAIAGSDIAGTEVSGAEFCGTEVSGEPLVIDAVAGTVGRMVELHGNDTVVVSI